MPNAIPLPDPLPLPAPPALAWFLEILTFLLHLLAMNVLLGGSILAVASRRGAGGADGAHHRRFLAFFTRYAPVVVAATVSLGVAPLLLVQVLYGRLFFTSSVLMAWFWLAVVPMLIVAYYGTYLLAYRGEAVGRPAPVLGTLVAVLLAAIAFVYVTNMTLMLRPDTFVAAFRASGRGFHLNLGDPSFVPRYLHFLLGAVAVAAAALAGLGALWRRRDPELGRWALRRGALWFGAATGVNFAVGLWFLFVQPEDRLLYLIGGSKWAAALLAVGILGALGALAVTPLVLQADRPAGPLRGLFGSLAVTLVAMILLRDQVRTVALAEAGFTPTPWVEPQWGVIAIFLVLLVAALGTIVWMVLALARAGGTQPAG
jgi:hypothetical protein